MNVQVKHEGTNITGFVQAYEREHKICTGIGTLRVEVIRTINRDFDTWDTIDIHENGDFKCRYYISSVEDIIPRGIIILECQDISKRLVDYFIPTSYTIDYPSYTRYWIDKFLTEAGIDVTFATASPGNIISNNTQLGLKPAYEQILTLLQMSGWFIYFNESEEAVVGPLDVDLSTNTKSVGKTEILNISVNSDDKMLRNRALILGTFDPYTLSYASADVTVHTRWNYDHADVRAVVIANSNIPNRGTAYAMANQIIKEFARITVEKHMVIAGAKNWNLGNALRVNSNVWKGKGLITTFGTSMSKQGLVTNVILDERCPRLFGFFDYGDYVYVGTFGDGVWKKHIKFDPTWYDFSTGLTNLNIIDLHINDGIFGAVGYSGQMFYASSEDGPWNQISLQSLQSSSEDVVLPEQPIVYTTFSGIMSRATIVDKSKGTVKFGVDSRTVTGSGDYFLDYYNGNTLNSTAFSGMISRGWIVEYDPFTGNLVGDIGSGIYPIHYSGAYNIGVIDIENDGISDYVSVSTGDDNDPSTPQNLGRKITSHNYHDYSNLVGATENYQGNFLGASSVGSIASFFNNETDGMATYVRFGTNRFIRQKVEKVFNESNGNFDLTITETQSSTISAGANFIGAIETSTDNYKLYIYRVTNDNDNHEKRDYYYLTWNASINSLSGESLMGTAEIDAADYGTLGPALKLYLSYSGIIGGIYYFHHIVMSSGGLVQRPPAVIGSPTEIPNLIVIRQSKLTLDTGELTITDFTIELGSSTLMPDAGDNFGEYIAIMLTSGGSVRPFVASIMQNGTTMELVFPFGIRDWQDSTNKTNNFLVLSGLSPQIVLAQSGDDPNYRGTGIIITSDNFMQLTETNYIVYVGNPNANEVHFYYNGTNAVSGTGIVLGGDFYPVFGLGTGRFIAKKSGSYFWCSALDCSTITPITLSDTYSDLVPFSNLGVGGTQLFWFGTKSTPPSEAGSYIIVTNQAGTVLFRTKISGSGFSINSSTGKGIIAGNFFVATNYATIPPSGGTVLYLDNIYPGALFMVLQREGMNYNLIQQASKPIRIDISNNSPVLSVQDTENTFQSNFVYGNVLTQVFPGGNLDSSRRVEDYRYTYLEIPYSGGMGTTVSGVAINEIGLYVTQSGVYGADIVSYSGGFDILYSVPSGYPNRIETSNYGLGGQYIFVTTSGDTPMFFQKDPGDFSFTAYPGLPNSRATIIRLDDRI